MVSGELGLFKRCSSSTPSSGLPQRCLSCYPHSCQSPCLQLSPACWVSDSPPLRPLQACLLSTSCTFPSNVHNPDGVPRSDDSSRPDREVSATRNASHKTHSHSACNDAVARRDRRTSGRQVRRRWRLGHPASSNRAWADR